MRPFYQIGSRLKTFSPQGILLVIGLFFGILLCLLTPPFMVPDEGAHFLRAYEIAEGGLVSQKSTIGHKVGRLLPQSLDDAIANHPPNIVFNGDVKFDLSYIKRGLEQPLNQEVKSFLSFPNTALYSPIPYMPQAIGIKIARNLDLSATGILYASRVFNLICCLSLIAIAVVISPIQKWVMTMIAMLPMCLFELASVSADGSTIALAFLFVSLVWRFSLAEAGSQNILGPATLTFVGLCLALTKIAYTPVLALVLVIPAEKYQGGRASKLLSSAVVIGVGLIAAAIWAAWVKSNFYYPLTDANPDLQLQLITINPAKFFWVVIESLRVHGSFYFNSMLGEWLGWLDSKVPYIFLRPLILVIFLFAIFEPIKATRPRISSRFLSVGIWLMTTMLLFLMLYLSWSKVGSDLIEGIQGRYFIPTLPLILVPIGCFWTKWHPRAQVFIPILGSMIVMYSGAITVFFVFRRYYLP